MLCGHVHISGENTLLEEWTQKLRRNYKTGVGAHTANAGQIYNVGCMMPWMNYAPRSLDEIIKRWDKYHLEK